MSATNVIISIIIIALIIVGGAYYMGYFEQEPVKLEDAADQVSE